MIRSLLNNLYIVLFSLLLASCGGGTGGGGNGNGGSGGGGGSNNQAPAFSIGGVVNDLSGTLILLNNGSDDLTVSANGSFNFSTKLADGSAYSITISSMPATQLCSVINGSGSIDGDDVTDISITCTDKTWTVGGSVSGLSGSLTLQDNSGDDLTVNANGNFTFATGLANAMAYNVTIVSSPVDQNCVVSSGSGNINLSDIENVSVICTTATWSVGGSVSGLDGILVLQNNGGDNLTINANGSFAFHSALDNGAAYNVTILSRPALQNCSLANSSGTIGAADVLNVAVSCVSKAWTYLANVDSYFNPHGNNGNIALNPSVAMDNNGNAVIAWAQASATGSSSFHIYKSEYHAGVWAHPAATGDYISSDNKIAGSPLVAINDNDEVAIAWNQQDDTADCTGSPCYQVFKAEYRSNAWSYPVDAGDNISPNSTGVSNQQLAMDGGGNTIIVWQQPDGTTDCSGNPCSRIFRSEYRNGTWTHPATLADGISGDGEGSGSPQVAMDDNDNAIIVWSQASKIYKTEYRAGSWNSPVVISPGSPGTNPAADPQVAMDNNGNAIIAWRQLPAISGYKIYKSEYRNGAWTFPTVGDYLGPQLSGTTAIAVQAAMDDNGNAILVWLQTNASSIFQIFKSEYRGGVWKNPTDLNDNISPDLTNAGIAAAHTPRVAMDNNGNAIIVWQQQDGTTNCSGSSCYQIYKSEYRGGVWKNPVDLADNISPDASFALYPRVAMDDNGEAIIVWTQKDSGNNYQIFKSEYR